MKNFKKNEKVYKLLLIRSKNGEMERDGVFNTGRDLE